MHLITSRRLYVDISPLSAKSLNTEISLNIPVKVSHCTSKGTIRLESFVFTIFNTRVSFIFSLKSLMKYMSWLNSMNCLASLATLVRIFSVMERLLLSKLEIGSSNTMVRFFISFRISTSAKKNENARQFFSPSLKVWRKDIKAESDLSSCSDMLM